MCKTDTIKEYLAAGKNLTPLKGKVPILTGWQGKTLGADAILDHEGNLGMVVADGDLVVDVDPKNGGDEIYERLLADTGVELIPSVLTPSGGFHVYLTGTGGGSFKKNVKAYPGIDFLTAGSQCVIVSSKIKGKVYQWADEDFGYFDEAAVPDGLLDVIRQDGTGGGSGAVDVEGEDLGDFAGMDLPGGGDDMSEDDVQALLDKIDNGLPNDDWVRVGMALQGWDNSRGLELWEAWSVGAENYVEGETAKRWRSFSSGGGVKLGTLVHMGRAADFDANEAVVETMIKRIEKADKRTVTIELAKAIRELKLDVMPRERLAKVIQLRLKELDGGVTPPIAACRDMISDVTAAPMGDAEAPDWCNAWVYINTHRGYVDFKKLQLHKAEAFNLINTKRVPPGPNGGAMLASQFAALSGYIKAVDTMGYLPMRDERICKVDGQTVLNTFNVDSVPVAAAEYSADGLEAIERVKAHIKFICSGDAGDEELLTSWLAHQVQFPGRQMLWSPLIQSIPGTGKTFFSELMSACLGDRNVGTVNPSQVTSDFNGWATNVVVNVLEELHVKGHNRYEVVNALKPLITDRIIQINEKGVKPFRTLNTSNYIGFTNSKDALPLDEHDRRWWILFVPLLSLDDLEDEVGETVAVYFPKLFAAVRGYGGELRKWMLEYSITDAFKSIKQAPMSEYKKLMAATEEAAFEGLSEARELIRRGGEFFNEECVSTADLFEAVIFEHPDTDFSTLNTSKKAQIMKRLGFQKVTRSIKINGEAKRFWVQRPMTNDAIREKVTSYL